MAYLMMDDLGLTAQTEAVMASMQGAVVVGWHRGHPERRKHNRMESIPSAALVCGGNLETGMWRQRLHKTKEKRKCGGSAPTKIKGNGGVGAAPPHQHRKRGVFDTN